MRAAGKDGLTAPVEAVESSIQKVDSFMAERYNYQRFKPHEVARTFPETAETLLMDTYLTNEETASARVFRVYRETPPHFHKGSDEYLYVLSGKGTFWMGDASNGGEFVPGDLLFFKRGTVHALPGILEGFIRQRP